MMIQFTDAYMRHKGEMSYTQPFLDTCIPTDSYPGVLSVSRHCYLTRDRAPVTFIREVNNIIDSTNGWLVVIEIIT